MKIKKPLFFLMMVAVILTSIPFAASAEPAFPWADKLPEDFAVTATNDKFALALNEKTCEFGVIALESGNAWWSNPHSYAEGEVTGKYMLEIQSQILIRYLDVNLNIAQDSNSAAHAVSRGNFSIDKRDTGFTLNYTFTYTTAKTTAKGTFSFLDFLGSLFGKKSDKEILLDTESKESQIKVPLRIDLTENGMCAEIKDEELKETGDIALLEISILPYFNAGAANEEGYVLLPDGSGAVMEFGNGKMADTPYEGQVYGKNQSVTRLEKSLTDTMIALPVFGMKKADTAMLTLIESSAASAFIMARPNGMYTPYSCAYARYRLRSSDTYRNNAAAINQTFEMFNLEKRETGGISQQYHLLDGTAQLSDMAAITADAIGNTGKKSDAGLLLNVTGAIYPKDNIMGLPVNLEKTLTTFDECADMIKTLSPNGGDVAVHFVNWTKQGIEQKINTTAAPAGSLGGRKGLDRLLSGESQIYLGVNLNTYKRGGLFSNWSSSARTIYRSTAKVPEYFRSIYLEDNVRDENTLLRADSIEKNADKLLKSFSSIKGAGVSLNGLSTYVYGDYRGGHVVTPEELTQTYESILKNYAKKTGMMSDSANFYALRHTNLILQTPTASSGHLLFDYDVPFYQMVVSRFASYGGTYLNKAGSPETEFLKCLSLGALPSYDFISRGITGVEDTEYSQLSGSLFSSFSERAGDMIARSRELYAKIDDTAIVGFTHLSGSVTRTQFGSGEELVVNLSDSDYTADGFTVPAMSYLLLKGGGKVEA